MATKTRAYTISTKLQAMEIAAKTSKEAAAKKFSAFTCRIYGRSVTLTASDNFRVARIVTLLQDYNVADSIV